MKQGGVLSVKQFAFSVGLLIVALRFITLGIPGLIEPSDARYAQIAATMIETNDWVMPRIQTDANELMPYWSKPPLAFWLMAGSLETFGHSVWAARLPSALGWLLTAVLLYGFGKRHFDESTGTLGPLFFMSTFSVFAISGTSLIDPLLTLLTTASMVAFAEVVWGAQSRKYFLVTCTLLGLGVLIKGPVALVFPVISCLTFLAWGRRLSILRKLPWTSGIALFTFVTAPWFVLAELRTPGYLSYFLVEENFRRFFSSSVRLTSGSGHKTPYGFILLLLPLMLLPWVVFIPQFFRKLSFDHSKAEVLKFVAAWFLAPVVCLMFGRHVLASYLLPVVPPFALLAAWRLSRQNESFVSKQFFAFDILCFILLICFLCYLAVGQQLWFGVSSTHFTLSALGVLAAISLTTIMFRPKRSGGGVYCSTLSASLLLAGATLSSAMPLDMFKSTSFLIEHLERQHHPSDKKVVFLDRVPLSAFFLRKLKQESHLTPMAVSEAALKEIDCGVVVIRDKDVSTLSEAEKSRPWEKVGRWRVLDLGDPHEEHLLQHAT